MRLDGVGQKARRRRGANERLEVQRTKALTPFVDEVG